MAQFNAFLAEEKVVPQGTDIFMEHQLHPKIDYYIVGFIMQGYVRTLGLYVAQLMVLQL